MKEIISRSFLIILFFLTLYSSALPQEGINPPICQTKECLFAAQILKESMKINVNPCNNFYLYACGNWPKIHKNQNDMPQSTFGVISDENYEKILDFFQRDNNQSEPESFHKTRKLFSMCLNESSYVDGNEKVEFILQQIGVRVMPYGEGTYKNLDYTKALARATKLAGVKTYFNLGVIPNPYNRTVHVIGLRALRMAEMEDSSLTFKKRSRISKRVYGNERLRLRSYINKILKKMCKDNPAIACTVENPYTSTPHDWTIDQIENQIQDLLDFMESSKDIPDNTIPQIYSLNQIQNLSDGIANELNATIPKLNWTRYIEEMFTGLDNVKLNLSNTAKVPIIVQNLNFIEKTLKFIYSRQRGLMSIERDIWWKTVSTLLPYTDSNIFDAKNMLNDFYEDSESRKHRCAEITIKVFGMAINYGYSTKEKYINAKIKIAKMLEHIRGNFEKKLHQASWMDEKTKQRALMKLKSMKSNIVYPNITNGTFTIDDLYRNIQITDNFFDTMVVAIQKQLSEKLNQLNQLNDLDDEYWPPPTVVNGFYFSNRNAIVIPPGLIGGLIFSNSLRALDYGAIGSILGHELTHAFDNRGRRFNEIGNIENWWQNETLNAYRNVAKCFIEAYANYSLFFKAYKFQVTNSTANSNENISDNSGFKQSLLAYRTSVSELGGEPLLPQFENFSHGQLFTLAFANVFCENPTYVSAIPDQYHKYSPDGIRVNGVLKNSEEFSKIWNCPKGSNMNPSDKCSVW